MSNKAEHLFIYLLAIYIFPLVTSLFKSLFFLKSEFFYHWVLRVLCVFWMKWSEVFVLLSCLTRCNRMEYSSPGSSFHGILQARILEWVAIPFSRVSSWPRDWTQVSCIVGRLFTHWDTREAYILETNPLLDMFYKYFLPVFFLFIFLPASLKEQKFLIMTKFNHSGCCDWRNDFLNFF